MKYYINYSDKSFKKQQKFAIFMAKLVGNFDEVTAYGPQDTDKIFYKENEVILRQPRGGGYWLWKTYFINKKIQEINNGDYLFYCDSGAFFLKSVDILIKELEKYDQDIMGFEVPLIEKQWTKKELFINMGCDNDFFKESNQIMGGYVLVKKTKKSVDFFKQHLQYSCNEINITDKYNDINQSKYFIDHRHDQSIFSLLYKKYKLRPFKEPTQFGDNPWCYSGSGANATKGLISNKLHALDNGRQYRYFKYNEKYKNVLFHVRKGNVLISLIKFRIKEVLHKLGFYRYLS
ncbi:MAG: hypothetical protein Ctma_0626 [Catillopecten margaritatus gill symbiont]|uniref:Nucleotide-diphospho-sugar transferase domain-containing protein n=1 Tax=Catillopecten margaritatus gill symbiont TaxID=3083288 RepID=A0AAU6PG00_9GAMM